MTQPTDQSSREPLPCPFCGIVGLDFSEGSTFRWLNYSCAGCGVGAEVRVQTLGEGTKDEWIANAKADAIKEWNTRSAPTPITAEEAGREGGAKDAWISVHDRVPAIGQEVLVFGQSPWEKSPSIKVDLWDEIHEAPVSFSSATVCVGEGWTENESDDITHWRELPPAPAQSGGQG